jgi:choline dehydrogenase-like flavoprotein
VHDYVIVGAGSAGCVMAHRLGEDPDVNVCVIEAGPPDDDPNIHMPFGFGLNLTSDFDWALFSEPEPGLDFRRNYLPRGRVLGGSSSLNAMIYIRGNPLDYDEWAALGNAGWGYEDLLPYFKRAEDNESGANRYHGVGGPLSVSESRSMHRSSRRSSKRASTSGSRATTTSTARRRRARGASRSPSAMGGAARRQSPTSVPRSSAATSRSSPTRVCTGSCSRARARSASRRCARAGSRRSAPSAR